MSVRRFSVAQDQSRYAVWHFGRREATRQALFAHCVALTANATVETYHRRPRAIADADRLATTLRLDMTAAGWRPTANAYLGRVTKARIAAAVAEAKGDKLASDIAPLKKDVMVANAEALLADTGWLPEPLRTPDQVVEIRQYTATAAARQIAPWRCSNTSKNICSSAARALP